MLPYTADRNKTDHRRKCACQELGHVSDVWTCTTERRLLQLSLPYDFSGILGPGVKKQAGVGRT